MGKKTMLLSVLVTASGLQSQQPSTMNRLFMDQQEAMHRLALEQQEALCGLERELCVPKAVSSAPSKVKKGTGFGGVTVSSAERVTSARAKALAKDGVLKIEGALRRDTALMLKVAVEEEILEAREAVKEKPERSMSRFHAVEEQKLRSFVLLPLSKDPFVVASRELLGTGSPLGDLYEKLCGPEAILYDFYGLRTEPGSFRQPIHSDTPFQKTPPLFASFIALHDVTIDMGPTHFFPGTHTNTEPFHLSQGDTRKKKPHYALLRAGDLVIFDMRIQHFGAANDPLRGQTRIFLNLTFRNPLADASDLGHVPCIRPGFVDELNLQSIRTHLNKDQPFANVGDGLPVL